MLQQPQAPSPLWLTRRTGPNVSPPSRDAVMCTARSASSRPPACQKTYTPPSLPEATVGDASKLPSSSCHKVPLRFERRTAGIAACVEDAGGIGLEPGRVQPAGAVERHLSAVDRPHADRRAPLAVDAHRLRPGRAARRARDVQQVAAAHRAFEVDHVHGAGRVDDGPGHPAALRNARHLYRPGPSRNVMASHPAASRTAAARTRPASRIPLERPETARAPVSLSVPLMTSYASPISAAAQPASGGAPVRLPPVAPACVQCGRRATISATPSP